jgi:hypothetical protein
MEYHTRSDLKRERTERKPLTRTDQNPAQNGHKKRAVLSFAVMYKKARLLTFDDISVYIKIPSKHERSTEGEPL